MISRRQIIILAGLFVFCSNMSLYSAWSISDDNGQQPNYAMLLQNHDDELYTLDHEKLTRIYLSGFPHEFLLEIRSDLGLFSNNSGVLSIYDFAARKMHATSARASNSTSCILGDKCILWYGDERLWRYDLSTDKLSELAKIVHVSPEYGKLSYDQENARIYYCYKDFSIFYYDIQNKIEIRVGLKGMEPEISPDGSSIKFIHARKLRLAVYNFGTHKTKVFGPKLHVSSIWTPDSRSIVYEDTSRGLSYTIHNGLMNSLFTEYSVRPQNLKKYNVATHDIERIGVTPDSYYRFFFVTKSYLRKIAPAP